MKNRFDRFYWQARKEFRRNESLYGRDLAMRVLYSDYTSTYQDYMRKRDSVDSVNKFLSRFVYVHAMALLSLYWREEGKVAA